MITVPARLPATAVNLTLRPYMVPMPLSLAALVGLSLSGPPFLRAPDVYISAVVHLPGSLLCSTLETAPGCVLLDRLALLSLATAVRWRLCLGWPAPCGGVSPYSPGRVVYLLVPASGTLSRSY